tara:strand:- start:807 stop:950 length:144 start_codon:yes stop_codon:yes gene_type:complete
MIFFVYMVPIYEISAASPLKVTVCNGFARGGGGSVTAIEPGQGIHVC